MSNLDREAVRRQSAELAAQIKSDPAFKAQVINDPTGTLTAHNLPVEVIPDFLQEVGLAGEVQAYCIWTCGVTVEQK